MLGSIPIASSARTPPMPSSMYWARRVSSSPMYRRLVIQRAAWEFSGRSASSRNSGTRPMSTRQIWATTSIASIFTLDRDRLPVVAGHERGGQAVRVGVDPVLVLPAAVVDPLAEVALAVEQADRGQRPRAVGSFLEDVAGEGAQAARVDRERAVEAELGGEVRDRPVGRRGAVVGGTVEVRGHAFLDRRGPRQQLRVLAPRPAGRRSTPPAVASPGSRRPSPSGLGPGRGRRRGRPGPRPSGSCRRAGRRRPAPLVDGTRAPRRLAPGRGCLLARGPA